jgi:hypothetical protein
VAPLPSQCKRPTGQGASSRAILRAGRAWGRQGKMEAWKSFSQKRCRVMIKTTWHRCVIKARSKLDQNKIEAEAKKDQRRNK